MHIHEPCIAEFEFSQIRHRANEYSKQCGNAVVVQISQPLQSMFVVRGVDFYDFTTLRQDFEFPRSQLSCWSVFVAGSIVGAPQFAPLAVAVDLERPDLRMQFFIVGYLPEIFVDVGEPEARDLEHPFLCNGLPLLR